MLAYGGWLMVDGRSFVGQHFNIYLRARGFSFIVWRLVPFVDERVSL